MFLLLLRYNSSQYRIPCTRIFSFSFNFFSIFYFFFFSLVRSLLARRRILLSKGEKEKKEHELEKRKRIAKVRFSFACSQLMRKVLYKKTLRLSFEHGRKICTRYKTYRIYTYTKFFYVYLSRYACLILIWISLYYHLYYKILLRGKLFFHFLPDKD